MKTFLKLRKDKKVLNPIQDGGRGAKSPPTLPVFPL